MAANIPNVTEPVSRGLVASIGVAANPGTAGGGSQAADGGQALPGGGSNGSIGGSVTQGAVSFQQAPVNASTVVQNVYEGASALVSSSSQMPQAIQDDSTNDVASEYVARTSNLVASASEGYHSDIPRSNKVAELPANGTGAVRVVSAELNGTVYPNAKGIEDTPVYGSVTNQAALEKVGEDLNADIYSERLGNGGPSTSAGGNKIGDPTPQNREEDTYGDASNSSSFN